MSTYLTNLYPLLRSHNFDVQTWPGWERRARSSGGYTTGRPDHLMVHHTASPASNDGTSDARYMAEGSSIAPLANIYLDRQGTVWLLAAGATNTNGKGSAWWAPDVVPDNQMNVHAIGIECGNNGTGERWPDRQQDVLVRLCRVLCDHYRIPVAHVRAHFEWAPNRKVDPAGESRYARGADSWNMDQFRHDVWLLGQTDPMSQQSYLWRHRTVPGAYWVTAGSVVHVDAAVRDDLLAHGTMEIVSDNDDVLHSYQHLHGQR